MTSQPPDNGSKGGGKIKAATSATAPVYKPIPRPTHMAAGAMSPGPASMTPQALSEISPMDVLRKRPTPMSTGYDALESQIQVVSPDALAAAAAAKAKARQAAEDGEDGDDWTGDEDDADDGGQAQAPLDPVDAAAAKARDMGLSPAAKHAENEARAKARAERQAASAAGAERGPVEGEQAKRIDALRMPLGFDEDLLSAIESQLGLRPFETFALTFTQGKTTLQMSARKPSYQDYLWASGLLEQRLLSSEESGGLTDTQAKQVLEGMAASRCVTSVQGKSLIELFGLEDAVLRAVPEYEGRLEQVPSALWDEASRRFYLWLRFKLDPDVLYWLTDEVQAVSKEQRAPTVPPVNPR